MKLHCRTRKGNLVRITLRTGEVHFWRFLAEHRAWLAFVEGRVEKRHLRSFCVVRACEKKERVA